MAFLHVLYLSQAVDQSRLVFNYLALRNWIRLAKSKRVIRIPSQSNIQRVKYLLEIA